MNQILLDKSDPKKIVLVKRTVKAQEYVDTRRYKEVIPQTALEIMIFSINISEIYLLSWRNIMDKIEILFTRSNGKIESFLISNDLLLEIREYIRGSKIKIDYQTNMFC